MIEKCPSRWRTRSRITGRPRSTPAFPTPTRPATVSRTIWVRRRSSNSLIPSTHHEVYCTQILFPADFHRCNKALSAKDQDTAPCVWYQRVYKSLCPISWVSSSHSIFSGERNKQNEHSAKTWQLNRVVCQRSQEIAAHNAELLIESRRGLCLVTSDLVPPLLLRRFRNGMSSRSRVHSLERSEPSPSSPSSEHSCFHVFSVNFLLFLYKGNLINSIILSTLWSSLNRSSSEGRQGRCLGALI